MLLALDLATTTGWCLGRGDVLPVLGSCKMPDTKDDVGTFLDFWYRRLHLLITDAQAEAGLECHPSPYGARNDNKADLKVCFEAPMTPRAKFDPRPGKEGKILQAPTSEATQRKLKGLAGVTEMVCVQRNVLCEEVNIQTIKAAASKGGAEKGDMMAACQRVGLHPKVHDEADAFFIWILMMRAYARQYQHIWDQKLYGPRSLV